MSIIGVFGLVLNLYSLILLVRVLMSWIPNLDHSQPVVQLLYDITEPVLRPVREILPPTPGVDFSPLVVMLLISVIRMVLRV